MIYNRNSCNSTSGIEDLVICGRNRDFPGETSVSEAPLAAAVVGFGWIGDFW